MSPELLIGFAFGFVVTEVVRDILRRRRRKKEDDSPPLR